MRNLPKGYYAVTNNADAKDITVFRYKGTDYAVKYGKNLFSSGIEAAKKAKDIPKTVLNGLNYDKFLTPVLLFDGGEHTLDKFFIQKPLTFLGQNADINPNIFSKVRTSSPKFNPEREKNETVIKGSFWWGKMYISTCIDNMIFDGFTFNLYRIKAEPHSGESENFAFRNIIFSEASGGPIFEISAMNKKSSPKRTLEFTNIYLKNFDGLDYANGLFEVCANKATFNGIYFENTDKRFGFCDISRRTVNCPENAKQCEITLNGCFIKNTVGEHGISFSCNKNQRIDFTVNDSVFINASGIDESPIMPKISEKSTVTFNNSVFKETRNLNKSVCLINAECKNIKFNGCKITGFKNEFSFEQALPEKPPENLTPFKVTLDDKHTILSDADFTALNKLYKGRKPYYGDLHAHSNCGGKSDGKTPIADYTKIMDSLSIDFTALVDHRQMRGYFLPTWDTKRFIYGMEPSTTITWATDAAPGYNKAHYCMMFPNEYGLCMVFANFPEFGFKGDELTGFSKYPVFTKERFDELVEFIHKIGGLIVHAHPKDLLSSKNPLDYYFGENTFLETISVNSWCNMTYKNYQLWDSILKSGKHVYTSGGADAHGNITNDAISTFYTKEKSGLAFFKQMKSGDFTVGYMGIKMCIGSNPTGSQISYKKGMTLTLKVGDFFKPHYKKGHTYNLRIFTDKGLAYSGIFNGKKTQQLALSVKKRCYYRADVFDLSAGHIIAISNPIWLDK